MHPLKREKRVLAHSLTFFVFVSALKACFASCHTFKKATLNPRDFIDEVGERGVIRGLDLEKKKIGTAIIKIFHREAPH